ncbi:hypothetical protein [Streptomyces regalis]|uniref:Uncharacterized protein n=1 Tax=Streptomyces regalis TaxID=68262 RepID=A0A117MRQ5_9ACTN|nr:hypothetical protein [Streptomyces regalis]KUL32142.1 hypothetical protein ADL12_23375 [Streptomyces regalis]
MRINRRQPHATALRTSATPQVEGPPLLTKSRILETEDQAGALADGDEFDVGWDEEGYEREP